MKYVSPGSLLLAWYTQRTEEGGGGASVVIDTHRTKRRCFTSPGGKLSAPVIQFWC